MLQGSQHAAGLMALFVFGSGAASTFSLGASLESSANFTALAPNVRLADKVVAQAESFRSRIGAVWLGGVLPATRTPTSIFVEIDDSKSLARTLPSRNGDGHQVWLVGSESAVTEHLLHHELVHVVFGSQPTGDMPDWANEGVASRYDNQHRQHIREQKLAEFVRINSWPHLSRLFRGQIRQQWQYATAVSVADFLIQQEGPERFVRFAVASQHGVEQALQTHYAIESIEELEARWRQSVRRQFDPPLMARVNERATSSVRYVR